MKKIGMFFLGLLCLGLFASAQNIELSLISSAGGVLESDELSMNFTIGDLAIEAFETQDLFLTQGFLQPEKQINISINQNVHTLNLHIYPNPAFDVFNIEMEFDQWFKYQGDLQMAIIDMNGKFIKQEELSNPNTNIEINQLMSGVYYVVITSEELAFRDVYMLQKVKK